MCAFPFPHATHTLCTHLPPSCRLLCEEIEVGESTPRLIVSGLVGHYLPADLEGKLVIIAANLKPKPFVGKDSHGMVCEMSSRPALRSEWLGALGLGMWWLLS